ncbi:UNVERIFIED_CONTAM: hypothetical protein GTU68_031886 [Idotea baltica]|nr:hypothetical protein [Idotea baltica]
MLTATNINFDDESLNNYGDVLSHATWIRRGFLANENKPIFRSHNRFGNRVDTIEFHPAYHEIMQLGINNKLHSLPWTDNNNGSHLTRLALNYMHTQNESGTSCPLTMTFAAVPALRKHFAKANEWIPKILSNKYDGRNIPYFEKEGLTIGMAMTEKQGGTDVKANTTMAKPISKSGNGEAYLLVGHKWFCSAPMSDAFLTLAQTEKGISCFLFPRFKPDGTKNDFAIQRLKDKLGNRSNASSEIEFNNAFAWLIGDEGRGISIVIDMVAMTRYDCMIGSAGLMRRGVAEAIHHIKQRKVFGKTLANHDLMKNVAADLCLETEAALAMTIKAAMCLESAQEADKLLLRLLLPIGKYWITKRTSSVMVEAMECLGGNGYIEESILPRLYREAPVNAIWEGSGNVQCLDILRAINKEKDVLEVFINELETAKGFNTNYDLFVEILKQNIEKFTTSVFQLRVFAERLAIGFQAAQLIKLSHPKIANTFCNNRLTDCKSLMFGTLNEQSNCSFIIERYLQV